VTKTGDVPFGGGGFGDCWAGIFLGRHKVVMKCSRSHIATKTAKIRAEREMKVWKRLRHPNVLPFIGSVLLELPPLMLFMVSPWMENGDLRSYIRSNPDTDRLLLLSQIAAGLEYLHESKVVHGDLKAANILISERHEACIADFGLAEIVEANENSADSNANSSDWKYGGHPRWQAPELHEDYHRTKRSDVFAFGRVIYETFTGDVPFASLKHQQVQVLAIRGELERHLKIPSEEGRLRGFSDDMWRFMVNCCNKDPKKRPSAQDVAGYMRYALRLRTQAAPQKSRARSRKAAEGSQRSNFSSPTSPPEGRCQIQ